MIELRGRVAQYLLARHESVTSRADTRPDGHYTAGDLRFITTAMKIVTDLERIGDQAVNIAQRAIELNREPS